jgi:heat shock protein HslJ
MVVEISLYFASKFLNMKALLLSAILIIICGTTFAKRANPLIEWGGMWQIKSLANASDKLITFKSKVNTVEINATENNMRIHIGCNQLNTKINGVGRDNVSFGSVMMTRMGCPPALAKQEQQIARIIGKIDKYTIGAKGKEIIFWNQNKKLMVIKSATANKKISVSSPTKVKSATYRIIQQLENGEMVERNLMKTSFAIGVNGAKNYSANVGCNTMNGEVEYKGENGIVFKSGIMTQMACMGDVNVCESNFIKNIARVNKISVEANHTMLFEDGELIMMLERQ